MTTQQQEIHGTYEDIRYECDGGVATVVINRPHALNSLRLLTVQELRQAFERADADPAVGVIVLRGEGTRAFCAGGDQKETVSKIGPDGFREYCHAMHDMFRAMRGGGTPIVAAVRGWCIGGGHELHCFADLTLADETARFGQVGAKTGGAPLFITRLLPRIVGEKKAREILYQCKQYTAAEALEMGLVNEVVPADDFEDAIARTAQDLLAKSPSVIRALKFGTGADDVFGDNVVNLMIEMLAPYFGSEEQREATTAFAEKRDPDFSRFRVAR